MLTAFPKKASPQKKITIIFFYFFVVYSAVFLSQTQIDKTRNRYSKTEDMKYLPSGQFLKGAALAYDELFADYFWIKAIVYFGDHFETDKSYKWLYHLLDVVSTLDPYFEYTYEFGGVALAYWIKDENLSIKLLKKGMINVPKTHARYWTIPFFLGFNYMYYKKDFATAARYLEEATKYPGHPRYLPLLVARLYTNTKDPEIAIKFLQEIYRSTKNEEAKKDILKRINEIVVERDIFILEEMRDKYHKKIGSYPSNLGELISEGFLKEMPREPFGGKYFMKEDHSIHSSVVRKRMELFID
tara:strand:- start:3139 stop:4038 length:900 start_codon:yes stop_codon:yes gene_type:complete